MLAIRDFEYWDTLQDFLVPVRTDVRDTGIAGSRGQICGLILNKHIVMKSRDRNLHLK
jgi:hypothetical protein